MSAAIATMTEAMLEAAHEAAYASRHLPWREAEQARWAAILAVMPEQDDARRLLWAMNNMGMDNDFHQRFISHVLSVGGVGDLSDCRTFIDSVWSTKNPTLTPLSNPRPTNQLKETK